MAHGAEPSTGTVTLTLDGQPQAPVPLALVNGVDQATLTTAAQGAGPHIVTANYGGDSGFAPSTATPLTQTITPAPVTTPATPVVLTPYQRDMIFVTTLYRDILGRAPDSAGLSYWVNRLLAGATPSQVAQGFWNSPEHRTLVSRHRAPQISYGAALADALQTSQPVVAPSPQTAFVTALYRDILGRTPDSAGLSAWVNYMLRGGSQTQVAMAIWNSPEHRTLVRRHRAPQISYGSALADASQAANNA